jgi:hypothetical protein
VLPRRFGLFRRPLLRRRRLFGAALIGGLGFAAGRASKPAVAPAGEPATELTTRLKDLADLHSSGALSDAEFESAKRRLLES